MWNKEINSNPYKAFPFQGHIKAKNKDSDVKQQYLDILMQLKFSLFLN